MADILILSAYLIGGLQLPAPLTLDVKVIPGIRISAPPQLPAWRGTAVKLRPPSGR